ncbi:hypothetical protein SAMN04487775_102208 [Treponema bryantii]|uniref:DUF4878 domain-containing protein n=1 Tax=Treponema bryantii TaxID=163 RepID=A0A1I3IY51_9SPIR|nr:hypothetical protein [Treponema bryantii]SFI52793.1 hypothetical protein SAMN04487775_102208 [Treponema bryantii]
MKKIYVLLSLVFVVSLISCGSQPKAEEPKPEAPVVNDAEPVVEVDEVVEVDDDVELINEEVSMPEEDDDEYLRSTQALSAEELVTKDEFAEDKAEILRIIKELQKVMEKEDVEAWLKYVDKDSKTFYSNPANIRKVNKKLPNKAIVLNGIGDYFKYVFIPSRKNREITEIRYISKTNTKAVQVNEDDSITRYYQFIKVNGKWYVQLDRV